MECKGFECFLGVAIRKFNSLISRKDFLAIDEINLSDGVAVLLFENSKCTVDKFGRVEWMGLL